MRPRFAGGISQTLRQYSVALGFVLGQIGQLPIALPRQPAPIVRTEPDQRDVLGFDPRERISATGILTTPLHLIASGGNHTATGSPLRQDPDWIRRN